MSNSFFPKLENPVQFGHASRHLKQPKREPLLLARKNLVLKKNQVSEVVSKKKQLLAMPTRETLLKK